MTNDDLDRALESLRSIEPPPPRADLTARIREDFAARSGAARSVTLRHGAARRTAPARRVLAAAVLAVSAAGAVFLTRGVEAPPPAEIRDVTAPASASAVEARFTRAVAAARIQSLRTVLTAAPRGERAEKPAGRPGLDRGELVRLAAARQWEALDPAAAAERYRGIARANPSGPAALVAESRLDVLAVHLKRPPDKHD